MYRLLGRRRLRCKLFHHFVKHLWQFLDQGSQDTHRHWSSHQPAESYTQHHGINGSHSEFVGGVESVNELELAKQLCCYRYKVTSLSIYANSWTHSTKIPTAIGALTNLQSLSITNAGLSGSIPNFLGLSKLQTLQLYNNRLTGDVPAFINTMTTRPNTQVNLQTNCNLTSTSTSPMGTNSYAYYCCQGNCGPLAPLKAGQPPSIAISFSPFNRPSSQLHVRFFLLHISCRFTADIAAEGFALCSLSFGRTPISNWNTATGCYYNTSKPVYQPSWCTGSWSGVYCNSAYSINYLQVWGGSWDLNSNYLAQNNLKRTIPSSIAGLKGLTYLYLGGMGYTGPIPTALFSLTKLNSLYLYSNSLTGSIPTAMANLKQLNQLYLDDNRFNGTLSTVLLNMPQLSTFSIQSNSLHGTIPSTINKNTALILLYLSSNQLSGSIPKAIGNLTNLQYLSLSNNARQTCGYKYVGQNWVYSCSSVGGINGTLPAALTSLTNLQEMLLSGNSLSGTIPSSISSLTNLYYVYLDHNYFTGTIPKIFGNLRQNGIWYNLLLHNNYFIGAVPSLPYSYGRFICTLDQNCQLTSAFSSVYLGSQTHCKPGTTGQLTPTMYPSQSPTPCT